MRRAASGQGIFDDMTEQGQLPGKVKWFSPEKGYGFIHGEDGVDRHFAVRDIRGAELPTNGDGVLFRQAEGKKGPRATNVSLTSRASSRRDSHDERAVCGNCGKRMVPRIITGPPLIHGKGSWTPVPKKSICPFCAHTHQKFPASTGEVARAIVFAVAALLFVAFVLGSMGRSKRDMESQFRQFQNQRSLLR